MIKLSLILLGSLIAFFVLPGILALVAGAVVIGSLFALVMQVMGSVFSAFGSVISTVFGILFSVVTTIVVLAILGVSLPILAVAVVFGMIFLCGCLFCTLVCGIV